MKRFLLVIAFCSIAGCASAPYMVLGTPQGTQYTSVGALLAAHPLPPDENILALPLGQTDSFSYHLVQIRDREQPHVHAQHDLSVTLLRGRGKLHVQSVVYDMHAGDVAVVPRGTPHYFVTSGCQPAAAFVTFTPPYDGKDRVPVKPQ